MATNHLVDQQASRNGGQAGNSLSSKANRKCFFTCVRMCVCVWVSRNCSSKWSFGTTQQGQSWRSCTLLHIPSTPARTSVYTHFYAAPCSFIKRQHLSMLRYTTVYSFSAHALNHTLPLSSSWLCALLHPLPYSLPLDRTRPACSILPNDIFARTTKGSLRHNPLKPGLFFFFACCDITQIYVKAKRRRTIQRPWSPIYIPSSNNAKRSSL